MNYLDLLEHSFKITSEIGLVEMTSRLEYLSMYIFGFTTYDCEMDELFSTKAIEVCQSINLGLTFEYIENQDNYLWFLLMCNMPFFIGKISWGTSIRGAFWGVYPQKPFKIPSYGLWNGDKKIIDPIEVDLSEWKLFINAIIDFSRLTGEKND